MTTTTTLPAPVARPFGFSASQSGTINAPSNPVPLNILVSSINSSYSTSTYSYTTPSIGIYFAEICVGLVAGKTAKMSLVPGGGTTPAMGLVWESTIHNGAETACRGGLMQLMPSVTQQLYLDSGTVFSNNSETMLNVFSVSDAMTDAARQRTVHAVGNSSFGYAGVMPLVATIGPGASGVFDAAKSTYTCTESGLYFISFTAGSNPFQATRVELDGLKDESGENRTFELTRNTLKHNGVTTLAREVLVPCPAGTKLYLNVSFGDVVTPSTYQLITFSAFPYLPRYVAPQAWVLLKDYSSDTRNGPMDPFYFNIIAYNANNLYDEGSMTVTIRTPGYYYVYISTGTARNTPLYFALLRNSATLIVINHMTTTLDAEESVGHGVVVALNANDVLKVVGAMETYSFSSIIGEQTSFFGMLLYGL